MTVSDLPHGKQGVFIMQTGLVKGQERRGMGSISFYAALSQMNGCKSIQQTKGYEMLRQISYATQQKLADETLSHVAGTSK